MSKDIFISYRRSDTAGYAGRINDQLEAYFGKRKVFLDVGKIAPGENFVEKLNEALNSCKVVIVLIGPTWLDITGDDGTRRLDDPDDFVRLEVVTAIQRDIPVIPVLLGGASIPGGSELPKDMEKLSSFNAISIRHDSFPVDLQKLIFAMEEYIKHPWIVKILRFTKQPAFYLAVFTGIGIGIAIWWMFFFSTHTPKLLSTIGVGEFENCKVVSDSLSESLQNEAGLDVKVESLSEIKDIDTARSHLGKDLILVIWGSCPKPDQLLLNLEFKSDHGTLEMIDLERTSSSISARTPDRAMVMTTAMIQYLSGKYDEASKNFFQSEQGSEVSSEKYELGFLRANALLLAGDYEASIHAYDDVRSYEQLRAQAQVNRGIAGTNWALQLRELGREYEPILLIAIDDLTEAENSPDSNLAALAFINRGKAYYVVLSEYDLALEDCNQAISLAPENPLAHICKAAALAVFLLEEEDVGVCNIKSMNNANASLDQAKQASPEIAEIYYWRSELLHYQAENCDVTEDLKQAREQDVAKATRQFLNLLDMQPAMLETDKYLKSFSD